MLLSKQSDLTNEDKRSYQNQQKSNNLQVLWPVSSLMQYT